MNPAANKLSASNTGRLFACLRHSQLTLQNKHTRKKEYQRLVVKEGMGNAAMGRGNGESLKGGISKRGNL